MEQPYIGTHGISVGWTLMLEVLSLGRHGVIVCMCVQICVCEYCAEACQKKKACNHDNSD